MAKPTGIHCRNIVVHLYDTEGAPVSQSSGVCGGELLIEYYGNLRVCDASKTRVWCPKCLVSYDVRSILDRMENMKDG
jgi:hypothetical protein